MISFVWGMVMTAVLSAVAQRRALKSALAQVATIARLNSAGSVPLRTTLVFGVAAAVETIYEVPALRAHPQLEHRTWWQSLRDGHPDLTTRLFRVSEVS